MVTNIRRNCKLQAESNVTSLFFRQDWCGDLPLAEEKKCLADSTGLVYLLEMQLKQHEG